jgi:hypothetical protein
VSTQITFDLSGLVQAIESSDSAYQVALYAECAEVQIADGDSVGQAPQVLTGRPAIARWIESLAAGDVVHHVFDPVVHYRSVSFVDELQAADGTSVLHRHAAEVSAGRITQECVTVEGRIRSSQSPTRRGTRPSATMTDDDPGLRPRSWSASARPTDRQLAGNFLG